MSTLDDVEERLQNEVSLLEAMYPDQVTFNPKNLEIKFNSIPSGDNDIKGRTLHLRLPANYPSNPDALPKILSAVIQRNDLRSQLESKIEDDCTAGEEVLDTIIATFNELCEGFSKSSSDSTEARDGNNQQTPSNRVNDHEINTQSNEQTFTSTKEEKHPKEEPPATVIIWLHHLLATSKRKQALHPPSPLVSGISKPGYPGVMIFSGPSSAVREHVDELKGLKWQGFQVRYESQGDRDEGQWEFRHGAGVIEVERMGDVVEGIVLEGNRETFLGAMKVK